MSEMFPGMLEGSFRVAKNRDRQRENKILHKKETQTHTEEPISRKNEWGNTDLTPYNAVMSMRGGEISYR